MRGDGRLKRRRTRGVASEGACGRLVVVAVLVVVVVVIEEAVRRRAEAVSTGRIEPVEGNDAGGA